MEAGYVIMSYKGRFLNFPDWAQENQMLVTARLVPLNKTSKTLIDSTTLVEAHKWNLEQELPEHVLHNEH